MVLVVSCRPSCLSRRQGGREEEGVRGKEESVLKFPLSQEK